MLLSLTLSHVTWHIVFHQFFFFSHQSIVLFLPSLWLHEGFLHRLIHSTGGVSLWRESCPATRCLSSLADPWSSSRRGTDRNICIKLMRWIVRFDFPGSAEVQRSRFMCKIVRLRGQFCPVRVQTYRSDELPPQPHWSSTVPAICWMASLLKLPFDSWKQAWWQQEVRGMLMETSGVCLT